MELLIKKCLDYGIKIHPYQRKTVLSQYEIKKVPDDKLEAFSAEQVEKYVKALYLCGEEMAKDWTKGHEMLKELGFKGITRKEGSRSFVSLVFNPVKTFGELKKGEVIKFNSPTVTQAFVVLGHLKHLWGNFAHIQNVETLQTECIRDYVKLEDGWSIVSE